MQNIEKKAILFIVEGKSDKAALGTIMGEFFSNEEIRFVVVKGDITTKDYVNPQAIIKKINYLVNDVKRKYSYKPSDILRIIHLTDTDGVFIQDSYVTKKQTEANPKESSILYFEDHMEAGKVEETIERNHRKKDILFKLRRTNTISKIPYRIYYNSCNLEHVLYGKLQDFSDEQKIKMSDDFSEKYEGKVTEFISFISQELIAVPGTYQETWKFIEKDLNSLNRHSNIYQIFRNDEK